MGAAADSGLRHNAERCICRSMHISDHGPTTPGGKLSDRPRKLPSRQRRPRFASRARIRQHGFLHRQEHEVTERFNLQFRTEIFDLFNHPNFGNPINTATSAAFGKILSTRFPGRRFRLCAPDSIRVEADLLARTLFGVKGGPRSPPFLSVYSRQFESLSPVIRDRK